MQLPMTMWRAALWCTLALTPSTALSARLPILPRGAPLHPPRSVDGQVHDASFQPDHILRVTFQNVNIACTSRPSVIVNGTIPGPPLTMVEGKTTWVRVYNDMPDQNLTMHWHGLTQSVAPFSDGTPLASQWPIPPLHFFDYEVHPNIGEAGSYFYHSHVDFQAVSANGALTITEASGSPPYHYDGENVFLTTELYNLTDQQITTGLRSAPLAWSGEPLTFLTNGKSCAPAGVTVTNHQCGPEVFYVEPSKTYRFRSIGGTALDLVLYQIQQHGNLTIIAADGQYTRPVSTDRIQVAPGQRFDWLLTTKSAAELAKLKQTDFWIQIEGRDRPSTPVSYALLRYVINGKVAGEAGNKFLPIPPAPTTPPMNITNDQPTIASWLEYQLTPLNETVRQNFPTADQVTRRITIDSQQFVSPAGKYVWKLDNHSWTEMDPETRIGNVPYLVEIYKNGAASVPSVQTAEQYGGWDPAVNAWPAKLGEVLEIVLVNVASNATGSGGGSYDSHPFHAHGGPYFDLGSGFGDYDAAANEKKLAGFIPAQRDTTNLYRRLANESPNLVDGWRAWRVRVDNAGVWMIHCHILQHMIMGMQTVFVFGDAAQIQAKTVPDQRYTTNGSSVVGRSNGEATNAIEGYLSYGGAAYGNADRDPVTLHWFDGK